jgi:hypothetical protein
MLEKLSKITLWIQRLLELIYCFLVVDKRLVIKFHRMTQYFFRNAG